MHTPSPHIREAVMADLPTLLDFEQALVTYERAFAPHLRLGEIHYYDLAAYIKDPHICVVVAEMGRKLVGSGYALIRTNKPYKTPEEFIYLGFMYVRPEHRGQGVNGSIMAYLMDWGKAQGHTEFQLEVFAENHSALNAYKKMGLVPEILTMRFDNIPPENQR